MLKQNQKQKSSMVQILRNDDVQIKNIYHISDIHIKNEQIFVNEYEHVFKQFYDIIAKEKESSVLVITGDILDKSEFVSKFCIGLLSKFLTTLTNYIDIVCIQGNHDISIRNGQIYDNLEDLVNYDGVYYIPNSGFYIYNNLLFCH